MKFPRKLNAEDSEKDVLYSVDGSYEGITRNPINKVLDSFQKDYIKNEKLGFDIFSELIDSLKSFTDMVNSNVYYQQMDIVRELEAILFKYKIWATTLRANTFLSQDSMSEVKEIVEKQYVTKANYEAEVSSFSEQVHQAESGEKLTITKNGASFIIVIPNNLALSKKLKGGEPVKVKI